MSNSPESAVLQVVNVAMTRDGADLLLHLSIGGEVPPGGVSVVLSTHDEIESEFFASFNVQPVVDGYEGRLPGQKFIRERVIELAKVGSYSGLEIPLPAGRHFVDCQDDGPLPSGLDAEQAMSDLKDRRQKLQQHEIGSGPAGWCAVMVADNVHLTRMQWIPGAKIIPLNNSTVGVDILTVLNSVLPQLDFSVIVPTEEWLAHVRRHRPAAIIQVPDIHAIDSETAISEVHAMVLPLLDLICLRRQAPPRLLGGIIGRSQLGVVTPVQYWVEGRGYTGNLAGGAISGESQRALLEEWDGVQREPRARLWLSLYADALADERWDYRIFRCFNVLEGIATEIVPPNRKILAPSGKPHMQDSGKPYTTKQARGKVFALARHVAAAASQSESNFACHPPAGVNHTLWEEVGIWVTVRNAVAHRGTWDLDPTTTRSISEQRVEQKIVSLGFNGTFDAGVTAVSFAARGLVEWSIRAALKGSL